MFLWNLLLAMGWVAFRGDGSPTQFAIGFGLAFFLLWLTFGQGRNGTYFRRVALGLRLTAYFFKELFVANLHVARIVLDPRLPLRPGIVAVPTRLKEEASLTLLANVITLTPGTLSLDIADDRRTIFVHAITLSSPEEFRREIAEGFERHIQEVLE